MSGRRLPLVIVALSTMLGTVIVAPSVTRKTRQVTETVRQEAVEGSGPTTRRVAVGGGDGVSGAAFGGDCARPPKGGVTDVGVTARRVRLASTVVQSGIGASFLASSPIAMKAVIARVNKAGGICNRIFDMFTVNDGWDAARGLGYIRNFINQGYFALPVMPSSEGLTAAIESGDISKACIPVIGTDGMLIQQYRDPCVWPVATATVSTMRIMAKHAYQKGSRTFGLVYDRFYRFGKEGAAAFRAYVKRKTGRAPRAFVGIQPGQASYSSEIQQFNRACNGACDFVGLLLEPGTAETWIAGRPQFGRKMTAGAQTLFNERFAKNCGKDCDGMLVWTGYNPPIGGLASLPDIRRFVNDVRSISPTIDVTNQFLEGAYLGMAVFAEAVRRAGPNLTRARLRQVMNTMTFRSDFTQPLSWRNRRHANIWAQAFSIVVAQGSFAGFRNERTGWVKDPQFE